jgi:DNA-binding transcriptional MerR regulator
MELADLARYRRREDLRLDELIAVANGFIKVVAPEQPSDRIAETLNERSLRYYITEGLVDRPLGKEGVSALYGYRHLLQILVIKRLQGSYLPIKRIREILANRGNEELEMLLTESPEGPVTPLRQTIRRHVDVNQLGPMASPSRRRLMLQEPKDQLFTDSLDLAPPSPIEPPSRQGSSWERFVLGDGVELHVRKDRKGELRKSEIRRIVERLLQSLKDK